MSTGTSFPELPAERARLAFARTARDRMIERLERVDPDATADEFTKEAARLYGQVEPFYRDLQCYARKKLADKYGEEKVPAGQPIPAHLLGNMWAQQWDAVYDLLEPYPGVSQLDIDSALVTQKYDAMHPR